MNISRRVIWSLVVVACCLVLFVIWWTNRGAPALHASAYVMESAPLEVGEPFSGKEERSADNDRLEVSGMMLAEENEALALYIHPDTTEVAILVKESGKVWYSNPPDRDTDPIAVPFEKDRLSSPVIVSFRDDQGTLRTYTSSGHSILYEQFSLESIDRGVRVTYTLEEAAVGINALPKFISQERLDEKILSKLDEGTARYVELRYLPSEHDEHILERNDDELTRELVLQRVLAAFAEAGYTEEDLAYDHAEHGGNGAADSGARFVVPIEYRLDGASLVVTVPAGWMTESEGFRISTLEMLRYFGAAGTEDRGYMFVPDGSGALIHLNNGKLRSESYGQRVYGQDLNTSSRTKGQVAEAARLPVFGMKADDDAWLAVIEQGAAVAGIHADISGKQHAYNHVYTSFALRGEDEYILYKGNNIEIIPRLSEHRYEGDIRVRFSFLSGDQADYSGMAKLYREYLIEHKVLQQLDLDSNSSDRARGIPFFLDILGAIDKRQTFLGIPYFAPTALTTYEQADQIAEQLTAAGVQPIVMRFQGWFNKGLHHGLPAKIKMIDRLGGREDMAKLARKLASGGGGLYPDVAFQHVYRDDASFAPSSDAARFITREAAERAYYHLAFNRMNDELGTYHLLSPVKLPHYVERFISEYAAFGLDNVSLRDLGDLLHADYHVDRTVPRESAKQIVIEQLQHLSERYSELLIAGGNDYALSFADRLVDIPAESSGFDLTDEDIPFYQMVVHGYVDYAGPAVNLADDQDARYHTLRNIELGAAPHFLWTYEPTSKLKYTRFDDMYATAYEDWIDEAVIMYRKVNDALASVRTAAITEHIRHEEGVVEVKYENGVSIFVNYNGKQITVGGLTIDAFNFAVTGGDHR